MSVNWMLLTGCSTGVEPEPDPGELPGDEGIDEDLFDSKDGDEGEAGEGEAGEDEAEEVVDEAYCDRAASWDPGWVGHEQEVVERINAARAAGQDCPGLGWMPPVPALVGNEALTCASRTHSLDMAERDYFEHTSPEGNDPNWRLGQAGFRGSTWAASIAAGYPTAAGVVDGWLSVEDHCGNIMDPKFAGIGIGYAFWADATYAHYWTLMLSD